MHEQVHVMPLPQIQWQQGSLRSSISVDEAASQATTSSCNSTAKLAGAFVHLMLRKSRPEDFITTSPSPRQIYLHMIHLFFPPFVVVRNAGSEPGTFCGYVMGIGVYLVVY